MGSEDDEVERAIQLSLQEAEAWAQRGGRGDAAGVADDGDEDVWDGFDNAEEMDYWKAILLSMGRGTQTLMALR
jgi:hypothetical protein